MGYRARSTDNPTARNTAGGGALPAANMCHGRRRDDEHGGAARALRRARRARRPPRGGERAGPRKARADRRRGGDRQDRARARFCDGADVGAASSGARATRSFTPRPLGPLLDIADELGGELRRRWPTAPLPATLVAALAAMLRRAAAATSSCSRTCTGPTRRRSTSCGCSAGASRRCPRSSLATYRDDELDRAHPLRIVLGELPRGHGDAAARSRRSRPRRSPSSPSRSGVDPDELHRRTGGQPVLRHRGARRRRRRDPRTASATPCWRARRGSTTDARALLDAVADRRRAAPSCGCSRRWPRRRWRSSTSAWRRACCAPSGDAVASGTRSPGSRWRRRCRPTGRWRCTGARSPR